MVVTDHRRTKDLTNGRHDAREVAHGLSPAVKALLFDAVCPHCDTAQRPEHLAWDQVAGEYRMYLVCPCCSKSFTLRIKVERGTASAHPAP